MRLFFAFVLLLISSCASVQRSQQSGYAGGSNQPKRETDSSVEHKRTAYELGYKPGEALSENQLRAIDSRQHLRNLERKLETQKEKEQYSKILPWLSTDEERIEFLSVPTVEGRQAWINANEIWKRAQSPDINLKQALDENDIAVGMPQDFVKKSWGEPQDKMVSGNPLYRNEKWKYTRFVSSADGYKRETRYVYFEGGRVVGWETE